jgi:zinc protease
MKEFKYELERLSKDKVPTEELDNAKRAIIGGFALSLEQPQSLLQNVITQKLYNLPADYWDTYPQKVSAITADDIQRVAQKYLDLKHLQIVAVGDASKTRDILSKYGTVQVFDTEGKPIAGSVENNK